MAYKIYGTNEIYNGLVVASGNRLYTTVGGAVEGDSKEVIEVKGGVGTKNSEDPLPTMNTMNNTNSVNNNPVIRTFFADESTTTYYKPDGQMVAIGTPLHEHQDGTIMTQHSMGLNDNSVVVTTIAPNTVRRNNRRSNRNRINPSNTPVVTTPTPGGTPTEVTTEVDGNTPAPNQVQGGMNQGGSSGGGGMSGGGGGGGY